MVSSQEGTARNIVLACASFFLLCLSAYIIMPLIPLYIEQIAHASLVDVAWITVGASVFGVIPASILGGRISDFIGRKFTIALALLVFGFSKFLFPYSTTLALLFLLRAVGGLYAAAFPATQSLLASSAKNPQQRIQYMGFYGFAFGAGLAIGPIIGGYIGERWGLAQAFNATLYVSILGALIILFAKDSRAYAGNQKKLLVISKDPLFWRACAGALLCMGTMGTLLSLIPVIESTILHFTKFGIGWSTALLTGPFAVTQLIVGAKLKSERLQSGIIWGFVVSTLGLIGVFTFYLRTPALLASLFVVGIGLGTAYVASTSLATGTTTPDTRGAIMGFFTAAMNLGYGLLAVGVVYLGSLWKVQDAFMVLGVISVVIISGFIFVQQQSMPQRGEHLS